MVLLQIISMSPKDSQIIQAYGGNRIQLVSALQIGGITPSHTIIRKCLESVSIPTMVMVRHHNNSFQLTEIDRSLLIEQVQNLRQMHVSKIVIGGLYNQLPDIPLLQYLQGLPKMQIVFHKAIDSVQDVQQGIKTLEQFNIKRVLTQGGNKPILQNLQKIKNIVQKSNIQVLVGGSINKNNVLKILNQTKCNQIHIGTSVRQNKFGNVLGERIKEIVQIVQQNKL